jgi:hypothetical protein
MTEREAAIILDGFRSGDLGVGSLLALINDAEVWLDESESYAADLIRKRRQV